MVKSFSRPFRVMGLAALLGVATLSASAQPAPGPGMPPPPPGLHGGPGEPMMMLHGRVLKEAGVSDAQSAQIKQIFDAARNDLKGQHDTMRQLHERAEALFTAPTVDANAVEQVRQQIAAQRDVASKRLSLAMIEASRVLSPEQRVKIAALMKQHREKMKDRMKDRAKHKDHRRGPDNGVPAPFTDR